MIAVAGLARRYWASGFTMGSTATQAQAGNGDVFLTTFDDQGTNLE